jgi:hypothetical protein
MARGMGSHFPILERGLPNAFVTVSFYPLLLCVSDCIEAKKLGEIREIKNALSIAIGIDIAPFGSGLKQSFWLPANVQENYFGK